MKVAIITDQHFGARKNSKLFHDYFLKFYDEVFFPSLEAEGITTVIDMGDTFDSRKGIDFSALAWAKEHYYDRLKNMGITTFESLYSTMVIPIMNYAAGVWGYKDQTGPQILQNRIFC